MDKETLGLILRHIGSATPYRRPKTWDLRQLAYVKFHYGISAEDGVLRRMLREELGTGEPHLFADIGAAVPSEASNTYYFYTLGWRGVAVDANPDMAPLWGDVREGDAFVHAAVGEQEGRAFWLRHRHNPGMSCIADAPAPASDDFEAALEVPMRRLDAIFAEHLRQRPLTLLCMDLEGAELPALKSNDWSRWRPRIVLVEASDFAIDSPRGHPTIEYMRTVGYRPVAAVLGNVILTRD